MLRKIEGKRRRGQQKTRQLDGITDWMDMNLSKLQEIGKDRGARRAAVHGVTESQTRLGDWAAIVALQCCVSLCCTMRHMHTNASVHARRYPLPLGPPSHPSGSPRGTELSSLCYIATSHQLPALGMAVQSHHSIKELPPREFCLQRGRGSWTFSNDSAPFTQQSCWERAAHVLWPLHPDETMWSHQWRSWSVTPRLLGTLAISG